MGLEVEPIIATTTGVIITVSMTRSMAPLQRRDSRVLQAARLGSSIKVMSEERNRLRAFWLFVGTNIHDAARV